MKVYVSGFLSLALCACGPGAFETEATESSSEPASSSTSSSTTSTTPEATDTSESTGDSDPDPDPDPTQTSTSTENTTFFPEQDITGDNKCSPFMQDCPDGEKCVPYASTGGVWDAHKCVPVLGDQGVGDPCTYDGTAEATDNCDELTYCWDVMDVEGEAIGICTAFCTGTADDPMCPPGYACRISGSSVITLCIRGCDPILQDCGEGLACFWANNYFNCIFTSQDIPLGEPCGFINDCAGGLACVTADVLPACAGPACCTNFCDLNEGDGPCAGLPGTACVAPFEEGTAPPGYEHVGLCLVP